MGALLLTEELGHAFLGALLTVCRADAEVNLDELGELQAVAAEVLGLEIDAERLLFSQVTPRSLAEEMGGRGGGPFRSAGLSAPSTIAEAFVRSALRVARVDGDLNESEIGSICAFARALGTSSNLLRELDDALDDGLAGAEN